MSKKQGNGLGEKNAKSWNPASMRSPMFKGPGQGKVAPGKRKGAGQK